MKEIIQELLRVEGQAKAVVAEAEEAARQTVADARAKAQELAEERRRSTAQDVQHLVAERTEQARAEKRSRLDEALADSHTQAHIPDPLAAEAVESICAALTGDPGEAHATPPSDHHASD